MKFNYRKIASVLASAAMLSSTIGFAAAASYPTPFVAGGEADAAIVVGANAQASDWAAAVDISSDLSRRVSGTTTTTTTANGQARSLAKGTNLVYLNDPLGHNVQTITDADLTTVLADGTFQDDDGTEYDYEQTIAVSTNAANSLAFSDSDSDLDDPTVLIQLSSNTATPVYTLNVNFNPAVAFNATASEGEVITLFGKEYSIGTSTDTDTLVLLGGASETTVNVGEKVTAEIGGKSFEVSLNAISDAATPVASVSINGESKTFTEGQTKNIAGIDVYAKTVFRSGDNAGYVIIQLGSDKLTLEDGSAVMIGTDNDDIEGTLVDFTGTVGALSKIAVKIAAPDSDANHIEQGKSFKDPVFGSVSIDFVSLKNGPTLEVEKDTSDTRTTLAMTREGNTELGLSVTMPGSSAKTIPFVYGDTAALQDDNSKAIHVVEGEDLNDDEYFFLDTGDNQYLMQLTKVALDETANSDVQFKDVISGTTYNELIKDDEDLNQTAGTRSDFTIDGETFYAEAVDADTVKIYSTDYNLSSATGHVVVYPTMDLVSGTDEKFAYTDEVTINLVKVGTTFEMPTGSIVLSTNATIDDNSPGTGDPVYYNVTVTENSPTTANVTIAVTSAANIASAGASNTDPAVLFVEEEDKSEATSGAFNAILLPISDGATYTQAATPRFSGVANTAYDTSAFDDADYTGYLTNFGTYVLMNSKDENQDTVSLTYSTNGDQMYAEVFVSEVGAVITPGSSGTGGIVQVYKDTESDMFSSKNIVVVGGSCINTVAAQILDSTSPLCGADFTAKTQVSGGQYLIKTVASPYNADKIALLVAGYEASDTVNAVAKVKEGVSTDVGEKVYPELSA